MFGKTKLSQRVFPILSWITCGCHLFFVSVGNSEANDTAFREYTNFKQRIRTSVSDVQNRLAAGEIKEDRIFETLESEFDFNTLIFIVKDLYLEFRFSNKPEFEDTAQKLRERILSEPMHTDPIIKWVRALTKEPGTSRARSALFYQYLRHFPSYESIEKTCSFLNDEEVHWQDIDDGTMITPNREFAAKTLSRMNLNGAPTSGLIKGSREEAAKWDGWWSEYQAVQGGAARNSSNLGVLGSPAPALALEHKRSSKHIVSYIWRLLSILALLCISILAIRKGLTSDQ